jgi:hypothetical protein
MRDWQCEPALLPVNLNLDLTVFAVVTNFGLPMLHSDSNGLIAEFALLHTMTHFVNLELVANLPVVAENHVSPILYYQSAVFAVLQAKIRLADLDLVLNGSEVATTLGPPILDCRAAVSAPLHVNSDVELGVSEVGTDLASPMLHCRIVDFAVLRANLVLDVCDFGAPIPDC